MVGKDNAVEVVELVLHDAGQVALHPFVVLLELLVLIGDADALRPLHLLVNARQAEASLLHDVGLRFVVFLDEWIDERTDVALVLGKVFADDVEIDDGKPDGNSHLRRCKTDAFASLQRFVHIFDKLVELRIVFVYFLSLLPKHGLTVCVDW